MNELEKEIAASILRKASDTAKYVTHYLALMRAVKLRLECEKMVTPPSETLVMKMKKVA